MKNIFDSLNSNNGLKAGFEGIGDTLKSTLQNVGAGSGGGLGGLLGSAALASLLGALFTGKHTQKLAQSALMVGAGALAWNFYKKWSQSKETNKAAATPSPQAAVTPADDTARLLLQAMVFAARADGHIDEKEKARIQSTAASLFPGQSVPDLLQALMDAPIDPADLAARVRNPEEGRDLYRLSCAVVDVDNFMERSYLNGLAQALGLSAEERDRLEKEARDAAQQTG